MAKTKAGIFITIFLRWLPFAAVITLLCGLVYASVQQNFRQSANDPQIQMAEDAALRLERGEEIQNVIPKESVDLSQSLSPYVAVYDAGGIAVASSGSLDGTLPQPPSGVFAYTREHGEDRVTWQPRPSVRDAIVVRHYMNGDTQGFVLAGRSLGEIEKREERLFAEVLLGGFATLGVSFLLVCLIP